MSVLRSCALMGVLAMLAACNVSLPFAPSGPPVTSISLLGGAVTAGGPSGYCVDAGTSRPRDGFAVIVACSVLQGEGALPWRNAVIVVQAGDAGSAIVAGSESALADFLETPGGATLLSFSGDTTAIDVRDTSMTTNAVTVTFTDTGPIPIPGLQQAEWRGFMDIGDRLVTVGLRGLQSDPLSQSAGESLLREVMFALVGLNDAASDPS